MEEISSILKIGITELIKDMTQIMDIDFQKSKEVIVNNIKDYSTSDLERDFNGLGDNIIYIIKSKSLPYSYEEINNIFKKLKNSNNKYAISKINNKNLWKDNLKEYYIYIGSKRNNAKSRFKQHLGLISGRQTSSLYFSDWWPINKEIIFKIYEYGNSINSKSLQIIEDILWDKYKPIFGKKGSNNKNE